MESADHVSSSVKRARASSTTSDAGTTTSDLTGDADSPISHPFSGSRPRVATSMSDAGSVSALLDDRALTLDDPADGDQYMAPPPPPPGVSMVETPPTETPPPVEEQFSRIQAHKDKKLETGQTWFLVSTKWLLVWREAAGSSVGYVDCSDLLAPTPTEGQPSLAFGLQESADYEMLPEAAWNLLIKWYGQRGPAFPRHVISVEGAPPILEVYLPRIGFSLVVQEGQSKGESTQSVASCTLSRATTLGQLRRKATDVLNLSPTEDSQIRLWLYPAQAQPRSEVLTSDIAATDTQFTQIKETSMNDPVSSVVDREPLEIMPFAVEVAGSDGTWPSQKQRSRQIFAQPQGQDSFSKLQKPPTVQAAQQLPALASDAESGPSTTTSRPLTRSQPSLERSTAPTKGIKGLTNLGNTCFMNSALQCLSNTPELKEYFVSRVYEQEVNEDNPLGNGGALAQAFGGLIQQLWSGQGSSAFTPRDFKWSLARFAPQFSGYAQQDTQELLAFLLDGLHEDLNRIKKKPYIEAPDWAGGGTREMVAFAKRQWDIYKMRNDSVIVDLFQGQYKSTLVCPVCAKVSIKFDPFMYLTLPLPNKTMWRHSVIFVPYDPQKGIQVLQMMLPSEASVSKLKTELAQQFGVSSPGMVVGGEIYQHKFFRFYYDYEPLNSIERNDHAIFWELRHDYHLAPAPNGEKLYMPSSALARHPQIEEERSAHLAAASRKETNVVVPVFTTANHGALGVPFFLSLDRKQAEDPAVVAQEVLEQYKRFILDPEALAKSWSSPSASTTTDQEMQFEDLSLPHPGEQHPHDVTAEIRADGQVLETTAPSLPVEETSTPVVHLLGDDGEQRIERGQRPFELHYLVNTTKPIKDADNWQARAEPLLDRARRLEEKRLKDGEEDTFPLLYKGGALVCVWNDVSAHQLLPRGGGDGRWGDQIHHVDDSRVAAEKSELASNAGKRKGKKQLTIEDCLDEFTREEQLGAEDPWYCPDCKEFRQATKKFDLWKVPDILVVHLKRFSAGRGLRDKLDTNVDFPIEGLDLSERVEGTKAVHELGDDVEGMKVDPEAVAVEQAIQSHSSGASSPASYLSSSRARDDNDKATKEDLSASILSAISEANDNAVASDKPIYDLFAVDNHFGGLGGGHYTSCAKNVEDGRWYYFDDSHVRPIHDPNEVKGSAAYLLFYRRRTTRAIGGKSREIVRMASAAPSGASSRAEASTLYHPEHLNGGDGGVKLPALERHDPYRQPFRPSRLGGFDSSDSLHRKSPTSSDEEDEVDRTLPGGFSGISSISSSPIGSPLLPELDTSVDSALSSVPPQAKRSGATFAKDDDDYDESPRSNEPEADGLSDRE